MVSIRQEALDIVVFVCVDEDQEDGTSARVPKATAFLTVVKDEPDWIGYVVTAAHVLEAAGGRTFYLRFNTPTGFDDVEMSRDEWFVHDTADVAVARVTWYDYPIRPLYPEQYIDADFGLQVQRMRDAGLINLPGIFSTSTIEIQTGNDVSVIGLFTENYGRSKSRPVARAGSIARMPSEAIDFTHPGETHSKAPGYLVEFLSWSGQSGSPVLVHRRLFHLVQMQLASFSGNNDAEGASSEIISIQAPESTVFGFLGIVSGHYDIEQKAQTVGDIFGSITTAVNSGIAIVTPAEAMRELLLRDDVVEDRQEAQGDYTPSPRNIIHTDAPE
jgi:hypothetical protein